MCSIAYSCATVYLQRKHDLTCAKQAYKK